MLKRSYTMLRAVAFLLITLASFTRAQRNCPADLIKPCECVKNYFASTVQCSGFTELSELQKVMDNSLDYPFDEFILVDSNIPYFNATWMSSKQIQWLTVINSTLIGLFDQTPSILLPTVSKIQLSGVKLLRGVMWNHFRPFDRLIELNIENMEVKKLGKDFSENVSPLLKELKLNNTKTSLLEDGVFKGMTKLREIQIKNNKVKVLKKSWFEDQKSKLFDFDFSYNPLENIPEDLFEGMENLSNAYLMGVGMKTVPKKLNFGGFLYVLDNPIVCDCKMSWVTSDRDGFLYGRCDAPPALKSKSLTDLSKEDFRSCKNALPFDH